MDGAGSLDIQKHFDNISEMYYDIVDRVWYDVGYYHRKEADYLKSLLKACPSLSIDAGCGPGRHTVTLAMVSKRVVGVDIARRMLEMVQDSLPAEVRSRVDLVQADVRCLPFKSGVAEFVLSFEVLEHLPEEANVLTTFRELRRVVGDGGTLAIEAPLSRHKIWKFLFPRPPSWKEIPRELRDKYYARAPLVVHRSFSDKRVERLMTVAGLEVNDKVYVRCLPAGLIERYPIFRFIDQILERVPLLRRFAREAIWCAAPTLSVTTSL